MPSGSPGLSHAQIVELSPVIVALFAELWWNCSIGQLKRTKIARIRPFAATATQNCVKSTELSRSMKLKGSFPAFPSIWHQGHRILKFNPNYGYNWDYSVKLSELNLSVLQILDFNPKAEIHSQIT